MATTPGGDRYNYQIRPHEIENVEIEIGEDKLFVDVEQAQRIYNPIRAKKLAENYIPGAGTGLIVSQRIDPDTGAKTHWIIDGQHRRGAARLKGITHMTAEVHYGLSIEEEATLFLLKNREGVKPSASDEYKVGLTARMAQYVDTQKILDKHGLAVGWTGKDTIGAINSIVRITEMYGPETLDRVLTVSRDLWYPESNGRNWDGTILTGLGRLYGKHGDIVDDTIFIDVMKRGKFANVTSLIGASTAAASNFGNQQAGGSGRSHACYKILCGMWNQKRRKNRIPMPDGFGF